MWRGLCRTLVAYYTRLLSLEGCGFHKRNSFLLFVVTAYCFVELLLSCMCSIYERRATYGSWAALCGFVFSCSVQFYGVEVYTLSTSIVCCAMPYGRCVWFCLLFLTENICRSIHIRSTFFYTTVCLLTAFCYTRTNYSTGPLMKNIYPGWGCKPYPVVSPWVYYSGRSRFESLTLGLVLFVLFVHDGRLDWLQSASKDTARNALSQREWAQLDERQQAGEGRLVL